MRALFFASLFAGCTGSDDPVKPDPATPTTPTTATTPAPACEAPEYGDGQCQLDLSCDEPDIDCFTLFDSQEEAEAFYEAFEAQWAAEELRPERPVVSTDDPRWTQLRTLLDRGWESYQATFPVGVLAERQPVLVLIEDATVNAFVLPDIESDRSTFMVVAQTGLLQEAPTDEGLLGLMLHELEHSVGLHLIADNRERMRKYYVADGQEPVGAQQADDPVVRQYGEAWRSLAGETGSRVDAGLGGMPSSSGTFGTVFLQVLSSRLSEESALCTPAVEEYSAVVAEVSSHYDPVADSLVVPTDGGLPERIDAVMARLRDECLNRPTDQFLPLFAAALGLTEEQLRQGLSPEALALVDGQTFVDGMAAVTAAGRAEMRALEEAFAAETGTAWSGLRYFSVEEAADDATVPVLAGAGMDPAGLGGLLVLALPQEVRASCLDWVAQGGVPYGDDLLDEHHAVCWRLGHLEALALAPPVARTYRPAHLPTPVLSHGGLILPEELRPMRLADLVLY